MAPFPPPRARPFPTPKLRILQCATALFLGTLSWVPAEEPGGAPGTFRSEDLNLPSSDRKAIALALTAAASNFQDAPTVTPAFQERAIVLARRIDTHNPSVILAESLLDKGLDLRPVSPAVAGDGLAAALDSPGSLSGYLWRWAGQLLTSSSPSAADRAAGAYLADLAIAMDPSDSTKGIVLLRLAPDAPDPDWGLLAGSGGAPASPATTEPGDGAAPSEAMDTAPPELVGGGQLLRTHALVPLLILQARAQNLETVVGHVEASGYLRDTDTANSEGPAAEVGGSNAEIQALVGMALRRIHATDPKLVPPGLHANVSPNFLSRKHSRNEIALACATAAYGLLTPEVLDHRITFLARLNENLETMPVPEIANFVRYLPSDAAVGVVVVPAASAPEFADLVTTGELSLLLDTAVIGVQNLEEALELAPPTRPENFAKAAELFESVQGLAARMEPDEIVKNGTVQQRLREIVDLIPNHFSARFLLVAGLGRPPAQPLTFQGSRDAIGTAARLLLETGTRPDQGRDVSSFGQAACLAVIDRIRALRPQLDPATLGYADALGKYAASLRDLLGTSLDRRSPRANALRDEMVGHQVVMKAAAESMREEEVKRYGAACHRALPLF
ncbi:hypothetical protein BH23VER1_BH23VER1_36130 [soil metagenome]